MKKTILAVSCFIAFGICANAQITIGNKVKMKLGDNAEWKNPSLNDNDWKTTALDRTDLTKDETYAWYRIRFTLPKSLLSSSDLKECVRFSLGKFDDVDETYLNGTLIGKTGRMENDPKGYASAWDAERNYDVPVSSKLLKWDAENVIAVRVYNKSGNGGMTDGPAKVLVPNLIDCLSYSVGHSVIKGKEFCTVEMGNSAKTTQKGKLIIVKKDIENGSTVSTITQNVSIKGKGSRTISIPVNDKALTRYTITYQDNATGKTVSGKYVPRYILTPETPEKPVINAAMRFGVRPGSPIIYRIPVSGVRPMKFVVTNLPEGVKLDAENGILSGSLKARGEYSMTIKAENAKGSDEKKFTIVVGDKIALTPPMGWNSWNCWGLSVSQEKVISSAQAILDKGLADYGYSYINVDDAWEAAKRNDDGTIGTNDKFPDMKGLGDWLHSHGFKFGIYSSPGHITCGGYLGSIDHEKQDAETYNSWGVDYLKYDWCGYSKRYSEEGDHTTPAFIKPYLKMQYYLRQQPRDIFYSLCQYGMADVWRWGEFVDANSWRTTGDITDTWESMYDIGFRRQKELYPYAQPGHWNDPDMLIVGKVGWSANLRDSRLTVDEQYTHISLWSLLASNLLIGCDVAQMDEFTKRLLCNNEVIAVNQDILGKQAKQEVVDGKIQIWKRKLYDGSYAVGIFNVGEDDVNVDFAKYFSQLGIKSLKSVRDLWRQKDISTSDVKYYLPSHGVKYLKVTY